MPMSSQLYGMKLPGTEVNHLHDKRHHCSSGGQPQQPLQHLLEDRSSKQCSWDNVTGTIEVGKSADMVVLDKNLYEIPVETIHEVEPLITVFRGEEVYKPAIK